MRKSDIQEFAKAKINNGFDYRSSLTPYNYTYRELLNTNPETLHEMHSVMAGKISVLRDKSITMLSNSIENMGDGPPGSPVQSVSSTKEFKKLSAKIERYSKFFDHISKALTVQRGIEASIKLDNNDYSSASELQRLIKNKVEMDMLD